LIGIDGGSAMTQSASSGAAGESGQEQPGPTGSGLEPNAVYALGSSSGESARLQRQSDELAPESSALLDQIGLSAGDSAIDVGCGPRGIIDMLVERVSPGGRVVGLDSDPAHVAMASELVAQQGWRGVEIVLADARSTGLPSDAFDLVHARLMLVTVPDPTEVLAEMVRLARPGGWVAGMEADVEVGICYPPDPAFDRLCEIFQAAFSRHGANPQLGRRMAVLYRQAGLEDVAVEARTQLYPLGHSRRSIRADLVRSMRTQIVAMRLADEVELDEIDRAVRERFADPDTLVMSGLMFLVRGRKRLRG
jgi:ubiquinone/menaquinone biosynthesis C-methylase UbiE